MKRVLALVIAILFIFAGCNNGSNANKKSGSGKNSAKSSQTAGSGDSVSEDSQESEDGTKYKKGLTYDDVKSSFGDSSGNRSSSDFVEKGTSTPTVQTDWEGVYKKSSLSDNAAKQLRTKILNASNTADKYNITGTTYYISPDGNDENNGKSPKTAFRSLDAPIFWSDILKPGDAVLFERGGLWRVTSTIAAQPGIIYGSYGTGENPTFCGSPYNYADEYHWTPSNMKNVWKVTVADTDIGLVVFDHGKLVGAKKMNGLVSLSKNGDYYFNEKDATLYVMYDGGNPGKAFKDIEIGFRITCFSVSTGDHNVVLDNLKIKYFGAFGVNVMSADNVKITNCELGFIGGARQYPGETDKARYGNGIQIWNGVDTALIEDCWVYQIFDAGLTWQGNNHWPEEVTQHHYKHITFRENLIEYCNMQVEFWHGDNDEYAVAENNAEIDTFIMEDNISRFAGYGWCDVTQDRENHIQVGNRALFNAHGCIIRNNIFDCSRRNIVNWYFRTNNGEWTITGNTFYQKKNFDDYQLRWKNYNLMATNQAQLEYCISLFDTAPKEVKYLGNW